METTPPFLRSFWDSILKSSWDRLEIKKSFWHLKTAEWLETTPAFLDFGVIKIILPSKSESILVNVLANLSELLADPSES